MLLAKQLLHTTDNYIKALEKAWITKTIDLIYLYPRDYEDRTNVLDTFSYINLKEKNTILVTLISLDTTRTSNWKLLTKAIIEDKTWFMAEAVWFNKKYFPQDVTKSKWKKVLISWRVKYDYWKVSFIAPDIETDLSKVSWEIVPIYPDTNYIPWTWIASKLPLIEKYFEDVKETLPESIIKKYNFIDKKGALRKLHFPKTKQDIEIAKYRLAYEELFEINYKALSKKYEIFKETEGKSIAIKLNAELIKDILNKLPFILTDWQKVSLFQILKDMEKNHSMQRLMEWDVWTGKTVIALIVAIHSIIESKKTIQVAFMAPTEILARQHFEWIQELLSYYNISSNLLVWSSTSKQKEQIKHLLKTWNLDIIVWTHALIQEDVFFKNLWFVVVDEQHRFWVKQREYLEKYVNLNYNIPYTLFHNVNEEDFFFIDRKIQEYTFNKENLNKENYCIMKDNEKIIWFVRIYNLEWNNYELSNLWIDEKYRWDKLGYYLISFAINYKLWEWNLFLACEDKLSTYYKNLWFEEVSNFPSRFDRTIEWSNEKNIPYKIMRLKSLKLTWITYPHVLNMTATPIPRTLALTLYWDQDLSVIKEYPAWRKIIHTKVAKTDAERQQIELFVRNEVEKWRQVFWISPLVEESEKIDLANAISTYESLQTIYHPFKVWLLHGKMKPKEKESIMREFSENNIAILSSTSVVEVWVNIPNATIMCIEWAERFWLSQLHQFRWRVGRGKHQSYCYLFPSKWNYTDRLKAMERTNNWFELAEIDLELRGPWEVYWVRQSWLPDLKIADLRDLELVSQIREDIEEMLKI